MEDENDFVTLKIWTFDLGLIKTQNYHLFESLSTKKTWKKSKLISTKILRNNHENVHFLVEKVEKDGILCFGQHQSQWSDFQGQKIIYILPRPYFGTPCISVSPKTGIFWFHCQWFWTPYGLQTLEICVIMLVEFGYYGYCSQRLCSTITS